MADFDARVDELGITPPDYSVSAYPAAQYGLIRSHRIVGNVLFLAGNVPEMEDGSPLHPGRLGDEVTIEQGYEAARLAGTNALGSIKYALGTLNRVKAIVRSLNFVACIPEFTDVHKVASGTTDLFNEVFGDEVGVGCRATIGVTSLAASFCFETVVTVEIV